MKSGRVAWIGAVAALALLLWLVGLPDRPSPALAASSASPFLPRPPFAPPRQIVLYAHVTSLVRRGGHWELRADPALFLSGLTAQRAAVEDGSIGPGEAVPNDFYARDDSHRLLTFRVAPRAHVTVMTHGPKATSITVSELARALAGKKIAHPLWEPQAGYWIRVAGDTVRALDQQYTP
jgi:hypothetical protein